MAVPRPATLAVTALLLLVTAPASAQEKERRGFIGLGIGPSAPFGSFAEASTDGRGGRAKPGYTDTFLNVGYRLRERWGVAAAFSYSEYVMRDGGDDDWWQVAGIVAGPMYSLRLNARTALDLKAMLGTIVLTPVIDSYETDDGVASGLAVDVRAAVRFDVFRRWAVFAEAGLQKSSGTPFPSGLRNDYGALISGFGIAFRPTW